MASPVVAMLSDFGSSDHYVGAMKGVVLGICPNATLVDVAHDLPVHDVKTASLELAACYGFFPSDTVFLVVVDPGVGSKRKALAADTGEYQFVAPDNGVLTSVFREQKPRRLVELLEARFARPSVSRTFEGRDRFAPAAAWLAKGVELSAFGPAVTDYTRLEVPMPVIGDSFVAGEVILVDRFGNLVTNIEQVAFDSVAEGSAVRIEIEGFRIDRLVDTYSEIGRDEVCALFGGTGRLEFAANSTRAVERLRLRRGAHVKVSRG